MEREKVEKLELGNSNDREIKCFFDRHYQAYVHFPLTSAADNLSNITFQVSINKTELRRPLRFFKCLSMNRRVIAFALCLWLREKKINDINKLGTWFADTLQEVHINILWVFEDYQKITLLIQVAESERRLNYPLDKKIRNKKLYIENLILEH